MELVPFVQDLSGQPTERNLTQKKQIWKVFKSLLSLVLDVDLKLNDAIE